MGALVVGEIVGDTDVGEAVGAVVVGDRVVGDVVVGEFVVGDAVVGAFVVGDAVVGDTVGAASCGYISIDPMEVSDATDCSKCRRPSATYCAMTQYRMCQPGCISATLGPIMAMNLFPFRLMKLPCALCAPNLLRSGGARPRWIERSEAGMNSSVSVSSSNSFITFKPLPGPKCAGVMPHMCCMPEPPPARRIPRSGIPWGGIGSLGGERISRIRSGVI